MNYHLFIIYFSYHVKDNVFCVCTYVCIFSCISPIYISYIVNCKCFLIYQQKKTDWETYILKCTICLLSFFRYTVKKKPKKVKKNRFSCLFILPKMGFFFYRFFCFKKTVFGKNLNQKRFF